MINLNGETMHGRRLLELIFRKDDAATQAFLAQIEAATENVVIEISRSPTEPSDLVISLQPTWLFECASTRTESGVAYVPNIRHILNREDKKLLMHEMAGMALVRMNEYWVNTFVYAASVYYFHT